MGLRSIWFILSSFIYVTCTDLPQQPLNGKQCFTCNATDCSKPLACEGDETQCFITTGEAIFVLNVLLKLCIDRMSLQKITSFNLGLYTSSSFSRSWHRWQEGDQERMYKQVVLWDQCNTISGITWLWCWHEMLWGKPV